MHKTPNRLQIIVWGILILTTLLLSLWDYESYQFGAHFDDARYVILARSLVNSDQYGMINYPGAPEVTQYPFGYPLILAPIVALFPGNITLLKLISLLAILANAIIVFWGWHWLNSRSYWWALAVLSLLLLAPITIVFTRRVMSEPIFITFYLMSMILAEQHTRGKKFRGWVLCISLAFTGLLFLRTIGIIFVASIVLNLFILRRKSFFKEFIFIVVLMIFMTGTIISLTSLQADNLIPATYLNQLSKYPIIRTFFKGTAPSIVNNTPSPEERNNNLIKPKYPPLIYEVFSILRGLDEHIRKHLIQALFPFGGGLRTDEIFIHLGLKWFPAMMGYLIFFIICVGFYYWIFREGISFMNLSAIFYGGGLIFWAWDDPRLLYPIQLQLYYGFLLGITLFINWLTGVMTTPDKVHRIRNGVLIAIVSIMVIGSLYKGFTIKPSTEHVGDLRIRTEWLRGNTDSRDIIMTEAPEIDYLYSERKTVNYPSEDSNENELLSYLHDKEVDYILVAPAIFWYKLGYIPEYGKRIRMLLPVIERISSKGIITRVYSRDKDLITIYRINK